MQVNLTALPSDVAEARADFAARHIGPSEEDQRAMLATLGYASLDDLLTAALPTYASPPASLDELPQPRTEQEALADLRRLAGRNTPAVQMIGSPAMCWGARATNTKATNRPRAIPSAHAPTCRPDFRASVTSS